MNGPNLLLEPYAWMGLHLSVPAHWELRRHGLLPDTGALVWVDRYAQRLELRWQRLAKEPDLTRMLQFRREELKREDDKRTLSELPSGLRPWQGVLYGMEPRLCHALHYDTRHQVLLQLTFSLTGSREEINQQLREILSTVEVAEPPKAATHWRAFGLDVRVPAAWTLDQAKVLPMDARLTFSCPARRRWTRLKPQVEVRRLGMVREWFDGDLSAFARSRSLDPAHAVVEGDGDQRRVRASQARFPMLGKLGPRDHEASLVRHLAAQNAMLTVTLRHPGLTRATLDDLEVQGVPRAVAPEAVPARSPATDQPILFSIPLQNQAVALHRKGEGGILKAPVQPRWWHQQPFRWFVPVREERGFGLDRFGMEVWEACDGERTVEAIAEAFALSHEVTFHEARVAVCQFIRSLTERELLVLQIPKECLEAS